MSGSQRRFVLFFILILCLLALLNARHADAGDPLAYLSIPAIYLDDAPVYEAERAGATWDIDGAGLDVAYLRYGDAIVLAGHSHGAGGEPGALYRLPMAREGDAIALRSRAGTWRYTVTHAGLISKRDMGIFAGEADLVIFTCTTAGPDLRWAVLARYEEG